MRLVVVEPEDIPGWLYPEAFPEVPHPAEDFAEVGALTEADFAALWRAVDPTWAGGEALRDQYSFCSTGVPHDAPDYVLRVDDTLVAALADLADAERWRVAQAWAEGRRGRRPNQGDLARYKELLKVVCRLAKRAVATRRPLLLL